MSKLHSKRVENMSKLHSKRVEKISKLVICSCFFHCSCMPTRVELKTVIDFIRHRIQFKNSKNSPPDLQFVIFNKILKPIDFF